MKKIDILNKKNIKWIIVFISTFLFVIILRRVFRDEMITIDDRFYNYIMQYSSNGLTKFFKIVTFFGGAEAIIIITALIFIVVKEKKYAICISINLAIIIIVNFILKVVIARPRPDDYNLIVETGYSFPSGHSMVSLGYYGLLIYFIYKNFNKNKYLKNIMCIFLTMLIMLIGLSRIYLRVHYLSDVLGGFCITTAYLILYINIWKNKLESRGMNTDETS